MFLKPWLKVSVYDEGRNIFLSQRLMTDWRIFSLSVMCLHNAPSGYPTGSNIRGVGRVPPLIKDFLCPSGSSHDGLASTLNPSEQAPKSKEGPSTDTTPKKNDRWKLRCSIKRKISLSLTSAWSRGFLLTENRERHLRWFDVDWVFWIQAEPDKLQNFSLAIVHG